MHLQSDSEKIISYVTDLELKYPSEAFEIFKARDAVEEDLVKEGQEQAFLSDKSLVSFVSGVSGQNRKDVLNSTLLAQLAANKKVSMEADVNGWYQAFIEVLGKVGWQIEGAEINTFEAKESLFEVENVIIDILTAAFGGNYILIIKSTLDSLKKMSESNNDKITVFENNTLTLSKGCFQIALAVQENDAVSMQLGTFLLTSSNKMKKILFIKLEKEKTTLEYTSRKATLNTDIYAAVREAVLTKLSQDVIDYVAEIEI